jgi:Signal transduction histidine kinase
VPLLASGNANNVVGVVYMRANLEGVYSTINSISLIYLSAALITIVLGLGLAVLISREITRPIEECASRPYGLPVGTSPGRLR